MGRLFILYARGQTIPGPRDELSSHAPRIEQISTATSVPVAMLPDGDASKREFGRLHGMSNVLMLLTMFTLSKLGKLDPYSEGAKKVEMVGLYWHFVDIVWIVIFTIVYLFP